MEYGLFVIGGIITGMLIFGFLSIIISNVKRWIRILKESKNG